MGNQKLMPPEQAFPKLRAQLEQPVENLRHDDPEVDTWQRVTLALVEHTFGARNRNSIDFATRVTRVRMSYGEAQAWHVNNIKEKKGMLRAFIKELEIVPPMREPMRPENGAGKASAFAGHAPKSVEVRTNEASIQSPVPTREHRVIVFTALALEYSAVSRFLQDLSEVIHPQGTVYERGLFRSSSGFIWKVLVAECGAGNVTAAAEVERAIAFFSPELIFFIGVAGGVKDVSIGDVVVGSKIYAYESGKDKDRFESRPENHVASYRLLQRARAEARSGRWTKRIPVGDTGQGVKAYIGAIAAGEKVVGSTSSASYELLKDRYGDTLAVDMEGYGFLRGAYLNPQVSALVIRGISDMIDGKELADADGSQPRAADAASAFAFELLEHLEPASSNDPVTETPPAEDGNEFVPDPRIEEIIAGVGLGDWEAAAKAAVIVVAQTNSVSGQNNIFTVLLKYRDADDDDGNRLYSALQTLECCVRIAPWIVTRSQLAGLANHPNFAVRSSAAAMCMDLAHSSAGQVPVDILIRLSAYDEDWYVEAPANAALKAMASTFPDVLEIFFGRLRSEHPDERAHAAHQVQSISEVDPSIFDSKRLAKELKLLRKMKDTEASEVLTKALVAVGGVKRRDRYRYGL
ncbi:MAG TPA: 5'-methylthioadenosine/S-adenosylhomocysteine nucleosidase [Acidobacteriaceae bacterium]|jgi:nucleoside phosphorylase